MVAKSVPLFDAKARLSELLDAVERGQTFYLTRRGKCIAELRPVVADRQPLVRGCAKNPRYRMAPDFAATPEDLAEHA